jgi:hypothetical protein
LPKLPIMFHRPFLLPHDKKKSDLFPPLWEPFIETFHSNQFLWKTFAPVQPVKADDQLSSIAMKASF